MNEQALIAKKETPIVSYRSESGKQLFLLTKQSSGTYVLYKGASDNLTRLGKGENPVVLEKKYKVLETMKWGCDE